MTASTAIATIARPEAPARARAAAPAWRRSQRRTSTTIPTTTTTTAIDREDDLDRGRERLVPRDQQQVVGAVRRRPRSGRRRGRTPAARPARARPVSADEDAVDARSAARRSGTRARARRRRRTAGCRARRRPCTAAAWFEGEHADEPREADERRAGCRCGSRAGAPRRSGRRRRSARLGRGRERGGRPGRALVVAREDERRRARRPAASARFQRPTRTRVLTHERGDRVAAQLGLGDEAARARVAHAGGRSPSRPGSR